MKRSDLAVMLTAYAVFGLIMFVGWVVFTNWSCSSKWARSGMASSWGPVQGCLVQLPDGRWMPDERVREIEITPR